MYIDRLVCKRIQISHSPMIVLMDQPCIAVDHQSDHVILTSHCRAKKIHYAMAGLVMRLMKGHQFWMKFTYSAVIRCDVTQSWGKILLQVFKYKYEI